MSTAGKITGPWSEPQVVIAGPGLEDPRPFWDDDGSAYLIHSKTGAGPLILHRMARRMASACSMMEKSSFRGSRESACPRRSEVAASATDTIVIFAPIGGVGGGS